MEFINPTFAVMQGQMIFFQKHLGDGQKSKQARAGVVWGLGGQQKGPGKHRAWYSCSSQAVWTTGEARMRMINWMSIKKKFQRDWGSY